VHDLTKLLKKYLTIRKDFITLAFMLFDHIGGFDTILYSLSNSSTIVFPIDRSPETICKSIEEYKIEVLPATPTFLNLFLLSESYKKHDLSSLKYITYGTEPMPGHTLEKLNDIFPDVKLLQKYGTTEVGTLRSKSKCKDSDWVKIGGEGYKIRIVDGILQIKADSAMLGYLNAPDPFTEDGWFITGDEVEVEGEYYRILGRATEMINVGGEKVYPAEVEDVIRQLDFIEDVTVAGEKNILMGNIVTALIKARGSSLDKKELKNIIKNHCKTKMQGYKVPVKITFVESDLHSERFKKIRNFQ
jgi:long-chain acyl-CoA synthetase